MSERWCWTLYVYTSLRVGNEYASGWKLFGFACSLHTGRSPRQHGADGNVSRCSTPASGAVYWESLDPVVAPYLVLLPRYRRARPFRRAPDADRDWWRLVWNTLRPLPPLTGDPGSERAAVLICSSAPGSRRRAGRWEGSPWTGCSGWRRTLPAEIART